MTSSVDLTLYNIIFSEIEMRLNEYHLFGSAIVAFDIPNMYILTYTYIVLQKWIEAWIILFSRTGALPMPQIPISSWNISSP